MQRLYRSQQVGWANLRANVKWMENDSVTEGRKTVQTNSFPPEVVERLKWYVYRLTDPRNGETFYVGKGRGDRVFQHVKGTLAVGVEEDATNLKLQRIKEIAASNLQVGHVIHRHGIEDERVAYLIEAALIDAYPGLTNKVSGRYDDYGVRHVEQIIADYTAEPFEAREPLILICIRDTYDEPDRSIYDAVRGVWVINPKKAENYKLVLAHRHGIVVGAFRPAIWLPGNKANFTWLHEDMPKRFGFEGKPAEPAVAVHYIGKRVPDEYRRKGAANPVRFVSIASAKRIKET